MKKLSIVIPFLNEEKTILQIFEKIHATHIDGIEKEIIFINDGSTDSSQKIIDTIKNTYTEVSIVSYENERNFGKGYSVKKGIDISTGDYIIIQDADLEYNPSDYSKIIQKLEENGSDFCYGSRTRGYFDTGFSYSYISFLLGGLLISFLSSIVSGKVITDEPTCYKLFKKDLKYLLTFPKENGFEWEPAITLLLLKKGYKYSEVGISYHPRKSSEGKKIKWKDGVKAITTIIKRKMK